MKIKKMTATFGRLKNATLELSSGMNVIYAPNEYGKTTWCAFIKAMLYGIDTSERDRAGHLSAKTRFRPWDGSATAGTMELSHEGRDITMQRTNHGSAPFRNLLAVHTGTADFIRELTSENAGEMLTGVSEHVFERTAFISRPEMRINQTSDLEKRISSLVFSGDEHASYSDSDAQLRAWQRKIRYNKSGTLPALEAELREAEKKKAQLERSADELSSLRTNIARLKTQQENLEADLETHDKLDRRAAARRITETKRKARLCAENVESLNAKITRNGHKMTRQDINDIRETASSIAPLRKVKNDAEKKLWQAEKDLGDIEAKKAASPLAALGEEEATALGRRALELEQAAEKEKKRTLPRVLPIALITVGVLLAVLFSGALAPFGEWIPALAPYLGFSVIGLILALTVAGAGVFLLLKKPKNTAEAQLNELLAKYGATSADKLASLTGAYAALCRTVEPASAARDAARAAYESAAADSDEAEARAVRQISDFMPDVKSAQEVTAALAETEETLDKLTKAEFEMISLQNVYETLVHDYGGEPEEDDSYLPTPLRNREDTAAALARAKLQLTEAIHNFDVLSGEQHTLGDPAVIEGEIQSLRERIRAQEETYASLTLAIDTLAGANTELQTRFSPLISKKAGEFMEKLTDGRYDKLSFDKGFDSQAHFSGDAVSRSVLSLSDGTADEIYFSLRLAMCDLILGGDDPCPIILDDALSNFDDERCKEALDLLATLADTRQVILFSCHSREARFLEGREGINVIYG